MEARRGVDPALAVSCYLATRRPRPRLHGRALWSEYSPPQDHRSSTPARPRCVEAAVTFTPLALPGPPARRQRGRVWVPPERPRAPGDSRPSHLEGSPAKSDMNADVHELVGICGHMYTHTHGHTQKHTCTQRQTYKHTHIHTRAQKYKYVHRNALVCSYVNREPDIWPRTPQA